MGSLETLFAPERVAVIGATEAEGTAGRAVTQNLLETFEGEVFLVNPNRDTVFDVPCEDAVGDLPDVDVAVVLVPASIAVDVIREAAEAGVENVVVITAGFSETGGEGAARERELAAVADQYDLTLVGPNSLGVISTQVSLNATFAPTTPDPGPLSFMSQSGAFVTAVLDWASDQDLGFRNVVSLGNKAVVDEGDLIRAWADDPETAVILGYLEDVSDGRAFIDEARTVTQDTPIVVVKSGRTESGAAAAASHTGAIAGSDEAYEAGFAQAGVLRVNSVQELFDFASVLAGQPLPDQEGVAIVTNAGGPGVMTTDAVAAAGLPLASFTTQTREALAETLPSGANLANPVDIIGDATADRFDRALEIVLGDPNVGMGLVIACPSATLPFEELAETVTHRQREAGVPLVTSLMGGDSTRQARGALSEAGVPVYFDPTRAVNSLAALAEYARLREREYAEPTTFEVDQDRAGTIIDDALDSGRIRLGVESMDLLDAYGIPTPTGEVVDSPDAAQTVADVIGDDVVMKIVSPDISHKSDIGGVEVGVPREDVRDTFEDLVVRARNYQPDATIQGVQVQELVDVDRGTETIVGVTRDPQFGPMVMVGLGGIFVEVMEDTAFRVAPVSEPEAREMFDEIQAAPLLKGARGREPADLDALVEVVQRISQLVCAFPEITELDCNPVVALPDGAVAIDLRLTLDPEAP